MEGSKKEFLYDGAFKVNHECYLIDETWVQFNDYVGMNEIKLPIGDSLIDESGNTLFVGPIMSDDRIYPAFLSRLESPDDVVMMPLRDICPIILTIKIRSRRVRFQYYKSLFHD